MNERVETPKGDLVVVPNRFQPPKSGMHLNQTPSEYFRKKIPKPKKEIPGLPEQYKILEKEVDSQMRFMNFYRDQCKEILQYKQEERDDLLQNLQDTIQEIKEREDEIENMKGLFQESYKNKYSRLLQLQTIHQDLTAKLQEARENEEQLNRDREEFKARTDQQALQERDLNAEAVKLIRQRDEMKSRIESMREKIEDLHIIQSSYNEHYTHSQKTHSDNYLRIKMLHNQLQELKGNIRVYCKIRPVIGSDIGENARIEVDENRVVLYKKDTPFSFTFDKVFAPDSTQSDVFEEISQLVKSALDGYKVCIFAYGQTGSGKTFTMEGPAGSCNLAVLDAGGNKGMIQRSAEQVFQTSQEMQQYGWQYSIEASFSEIYNEEVRDLLDSSKKITAFSANLISPTSIPVTSLEELYPLLIQARHARAVGQTMANSNSSRSHFIFQLKILGFNASTSSRSEGILNLIDLAGSERLKVSQAEGERLQETKAINKSLCALGDVIQSLANKDKHIPYRNSKLTYMLQNCLGGDGKTLMFVNISPLEANVQESICSLRFAQKVNVCQIKR